jgi:hypothetical protein
VFDSIEAEVVSRDTAGVTLSIRNPTQFDAKVSLCAEDAAKAARPLGGNAFLRWRAIDIKAGATGSVHVSPAGEIQS